MLFIIEHENENIFLLFHFIKANSQWKEAENQPGIMTFRIVAKNIQDKKKLRKNRIEKAQQNIISHIHESEIEDESKISEYMNEKKQ